MQAYHRQRTPILQLNSMDWIRHGGRKIYIENIWPCLAAECFNAPLTYATFSSVLSPMLHSCLFLLLHLVIDQQNITVPVLNANIEVMIKHSHLNIKNCYLNWVPSGLQALRIYCFRSLTCIAKHSNNQFLAVPLRDLTFEMQTLHNKLNSWVHGKPTAPLSTTVLWQTFH